MVKSKFKFKHIYWITCQCLCIMIFGGYWGYVLFIFLRDLDREPMLIASGITGLCIFLTAKYFPAISRYIGIGLFVFIIGYFVSMFTYIELTRLCFFLMLFSILLLFIRKLTKLFIKVKVEYGSISIFTLLSPFKPVVYNLDDYNGYFLTEESIEMGGRSHYDYKFKVAWLSRDDTLLVRIPDFYRNFDKILIATNLKYKGQIEPQEYKPDTVLSFCDELFETRFKSMTQAGLEEHQKEHKIVMEEKDAQKKEPQKTYNWNFNNNNDTI